MQSTGFVDKGKIYERQVLIAIFGAAEAIGLIDQSAGSFLRKGTIDKMWNALLLSRVKRTIYPSASGLPLNAE